jgi:hypothetical protein
MVGLKFFLRLGGEVLKIGAFYPRREEGGKPFDRPEPDEACPAKKA